MSDKVKEIISEVYTVKFYPRRYRIKQKTVIATSQPYWAIYDHEADTELGFFYTENDAKAVVLSLDYMHAVLVGDLIVQREITRALERLRN